MIGLSTYAARLAERPKRKYRRHQQAKQHERITALGSWIQSRHYGVTRAEIRDQFPEFYDSVACPDAYVQIGRDLRTLARVLPNVFHIPPRWPLDGSGRARTLKSFAPSNLIIGNGAVIARQPDDSASIILAEPATCPICKSAHYFVVNRNGRTLCVYCDGKVQSGEIKYAR